MNEGSGSFQVSSLADFLPEAFLPIFTTLALSFLIGLEREEHVGGRRYYGFGGVRTFPLIGLCGYLMAKLSENQPGLLGVGLLVFGALLWLSYRKKLEMSSTAGLTSEVSGLFTFLLGGLLFHRLMWEAAATTVAVLLLLELKEGLEALAKKIPGEEIFTFTRFLLISAVILPIVPDQDFTQFRFNPFHLWLIVVVISGLSYAAYIADRVLGTRHGLLVAAVLGGAYSSTSTTFVLARRSRQENAGRVLSGAIVISSGVMYFRIIALLLLFSRNLGAYMALPLAGIGAIFVAIGWLWAWKGQADKARARTHILQGRNPLELRSAFFFAALFALMGIVTLYARQSLGTRGLYVLSFFSGLLDVDPYVMSLTQTGVPEVPASTAAKAILIAAASNNLTKAACAAVLGNGDVRSRGSLILTGLSAASLIVLYFV